MMKTADVALTHSTLPTLVNMVVPIGLTRAVLSHGIQVCVFRFGIELRLVWELSVGDKHSGESHHWVGNDCCCVITQHTSMLVNHTILLVMAVIVLLHSTPVCW